MTAKDTSYSRMGDIKYLFWGSIVIIGLCFSMYYGFIYFTHNNPPEISNVKVFQDGDKIKIDYKRKDEDGPFLNNIAINKDRIDWFIDNKIVSGFKNKREIPVPDEKDKKIFVSCVVTGYDGINKSKKVKS
ncbi:MAG TPA: hypothetical protein PKW98_08045, partial [Candidatus Wallbacteria bacterium]|nr:hypothetical protein [Candidatus Wallbacteria bacterium]